MTDWLRLKAQFLDYARAAKIPSKDQGVIPMEPLPTQLYLVDEIFDGLQAGIHDFLILKARQLGISTILWLLDLFWVTRFNGLQAIYIADDEPNKEIHRGIIGDIYESLPPRYSRGRWRSNNRLELRWHSIRDQDGTVRWHASRLMWAFANKRAEGQLGRSRGINYLHGTEMDSWTDQEGVAALTATLSDTHPYRCYLWEGTGQGYGMLYQMWEQAEHSLTQKRIFIGFWRNPGYRIEREQRALWSVYGAARPTPEESDWAAEVRKRYHVDITRPQLCWWRWKLAEGKGINGDRAKMLQEFPWLPEHAFQAAGTAFLSPTVNFRLMQQTEAAPKAQHYRYDWGPTFDAKGDDVLIEVPAQEAQLTVYEDAIPGALYIVAGDPAYGSSESADAFAVTVWRAHPDALVQVAEYYSLQGAMYSFAWVLAHLASYYPRWLIYDINAGGIAVLQEFKRLQEYGFGLATRHGRLQDVIGAIQNYLWSRPDAISPTFSWGWRTAPSTQPVLMEQLRNEAERGALVVRSKRLSHELGALRREGSRIQPGGVAHDDLAVTAAMAVEYWLGTVIHEIEGKVADFTPPQAAPRHPTEQVIRTFMRRIQRPDTEPGPQPYGLRSLGPGR